MFAEYLGIEQAGINIQYTWKLQNHYSCAQRSGFSNQLSQNRKPQPRNSDLSNWASTVKITLIWLTEVFWLPNLRLETNPKGNSQDLERGRRVDCYQCRNRHWENKAKLNIGKYVENIRLKPSKSVRTNFSSWFNFLLLNACGIALQIHSETQPRTRERNRPSGFEFRIINYLK